MVNKEKIAKIELLVLDVDGVLTDGKIIFNDEGQESKAFNVADGHGMKMLQHYGTKIAVISGRTSNVVAIRMKELGVSLVYQGSRDKLMDLNDALEQLSLSKEQACYVGDDVVDLQIMPHIGFAVAVADAHPLVKKHADLVTKSNGGAGAVREVCELILESKSLLEKALSYYLEEKKK